MRLLVVFSALMLFAPPAQAGFFDGYTANNSADTETMNYAADLEGRAANMRALISVDATYRLDNAATFSAADFQSNVAAAVRSVHAVPASCIAQNLTYTDTVSGWARYNDPKRTGEFWSNRLFWKDGDGTGKMPILVINDGLGAYYSIGASPPRYTGENVAQILNNAGHPVTVMALKGFDDKAFASAWGIPGIDQFDAFVKARGDSPMSVWIRDAFDAM